MIFKLIFEKEMKINKQINQSTGPKYFKLFHSGGNAFHTEFVLHSDITVMKKEPTWRNFSKYTKVIDG